MQRSMVVPPAASFFLSCLPSLALCMMAAKKEPTKPACSATVAGTKKRQNATKGQGLDNAQVTKMRALLKYNAEEAKDEDRMRKSQAALAVWDQCKSPQERRSFMESFKNDKSKDLAWTHTFFEECANEEVHRDSAKRGYLTTSQALKHWNLTMGDFKTHEEALAFVESQWEENSEAFGTRRRSHRRWTRRAAPCCTHSISSLSK